MYVTPADRVEVAGQPAVVARHQAFEKRRAFLGRNAHQLGPGLLAARPARHHRLAVAELEHAAVEVQHVRERPDLLNGNRLAQLLGGLRIQLRQTQIQPAQAMGSPMNESMNSPLCFSLAESQYSGPYSTGTSVGL